MDVTRRFLSGRLPDDVDWPEHHQTDEYYPVATAISAAANIGLNLALIPRFGIMGAAYANGLAYALQAAIAYHFSQRFYPIRYEARRLARVIAAALLAYAAGRALPSMPPVWGVLARGTTVLVVMTAGLWLGGFFHAEELRVLDRIRRSRRATDGPITTPADTTELAGEIVATDLPDEAISAPAGGERVR